MGLLSSLGIIGTIVGGVADSKASKKQAQMAADAEARKIAFAQQTRDQNVALQQPYLNAGQSAINPLMAQLGISAGGATGSSPAPATGTQDWAAYIAANPDVAAAVNAPNSGYAGDTPEARAADQYARYGQGEGRAVPTVAAPVAVQPTTATTSTNPFLVDPSTGAVNAPRPTADPREAYTRPETPAFNYGLDEYKASPGYQYRQDEARKNILSTAGATGALQSGAALKELYDRGDQIAYQDFGNERGFAYDQYGADRARTDQNFAADRSYGTGVYEADRSRSDNIFSTDRDYATGAFDTKTNNLFRLTGVGTGAANAISGANNILSGQQIDSTETAAQARIRNNQNQNSIWQTAAGTVGAQIGRAVNPLMSF